MRREQRLERIGRVGSFLLGCAALSCAIYVFSPLVRPLTFPQAALIAGVVASVVAWLIWRSKILR
jgi:ABC-type uncharacterized transport system permease subunit